MFALLSFTASADKSDYFFWNARDDGIFFNGKNMFSDHWYIRPGLKVERLKSYGGASDFFHAETDQLNETLAFLWIYVGDDQYDKYANKIKFASSFSTQITTLSTDEVYSGNRYLGRDFTQDSTFISIKKVGTKYSFYAMPFTSRIRAETFLWNRASWTYISEEEEFDQSRANDKKYIDYVFNYVSDMKKIIKAPYRVLVTGDMINQIFGKLSTETEKQKNVFLNMIKGN